jgi:alpha-beta hydrolase superfamily lysophospholipase
MSEPRARAACTALLGAAVIAAAAGAAHAQLPPADTIACPKEVPADTVCHVGIDPNGAHWLIAMPPNWNRVLVVHARGGPELQAVGVKRSLADLSRWAVWVREGYAYAASQYRRGGYGALSAAEDTENLRQLFVARFGKPRRTIMHGQSWGGLVGARVIELYASAADGTRNYDGALLTSAVLAGAPRAYYFRLDVRVVYQFLCRNHPRPDEPQYPAWWGLPADSKMTAKELRERINECTGVDLARHQRSAEQQRRLDEILKVTRIEERSLVGHLNWATFMFADLVQRRTNGRNPFTNEGVRYTGSSDDAALNAGVARYRSDPEAVAWLANDSDFTGRVSIPTLTVHAIGDPTVFVENQSVYRAIRERAGSADLLVQTYTDESEHSFLSTPQYPALMQALLDWIDDGRRPTPHAIAARCEAFRARYGATCRFRPDWTPPPFEARVHPRRH